MKDFNMKKTDIHIPSIHIPESNHPKQYELAVINMQDKHMLIHQLKAIQRRNLNGSERLQNSSATKN